MPKVTQPARGKRQTGVSWCSFQIARGNGRSKGSAVCNDGVCWSLSGPGPLPQPSSLTFPPQRPLSPVLSQLRDLAVAQRPVRGCFKHIGIQSCLPSCPHKKESRDTRRRPCCERSPEATRAADVSLLHPVRPEMGQ